MNIDKEPLSLPITIYQVHWQDDEVEFIDGVYLNEQDALIAAGLLNSEEEESNYQVSPIDVSPSPVLPEDKELIISVSKSLKYQVKGNQRSNPIYEGEHWKVSPQYVTYLPLVVPKGFQYSVHTYGKTVSIQARSKEVLDEAIQLMLEKVNGGTILEPGYTEVIKE